MTDVLAAQWLAVCKTPHCALHCHDLSVLDTRTRIDKLVEISTELAHHLRNQPNADILVRTDTPVLFCSIIATALENHQDKMKQTSTTLSFAFAADDLRRIAFVHSELPAPSESTKTLYVIKDSWLYKEDVE